MPQNSPLFDLIHSLERAEILHFVKKVRGNRADSKYYRLFSAYLAMKTEDEKLLKSKIKDKSLKRNFTAAKGYLYNSILNSVCDPKGDADSQLWAKIKHINFLTSKCLFQQAHKILVKAKKMAEKHFDLRWLEEIINCEILIIKAEGRAKERAEYIKELRHLQRVIQIKISALNRVLEKQELVNTNFGNIDLLNAIALEVFERTSYFNVQEEIATLLIHATICWNKNDGKGALMRLGRVIGLYENNHQLLSNNAMLLNYIDVLFNYNLWSSHQRGKMTLIDVKGKLFSIESGTKRLKGLLLERNILIELDMLISSPALLKKHKQLIELTAKIEANRSRFTVENFQKILYFASYANILYDNPGKAKYIIKILVDSCGKSSKSIWVSFARLLSLIAMFDLNDLNYLESSIDATKSYIKANGHYNPFISLITLGLGKLARTSELAKVRETLQDLLLSHNENLENPAYGYWENYFDLQSWLQSKIENKPMVEVRDKFLSQMLNG